MMQQYNLLVLETTQTQQYKQQQRPHGHQCFPICFSRRVLGHHFYLYYIPNICSISTLNNFGTTLNRMMSTDAAMHSALKIRGEKCNLRKYYCLPQKSTWPVAGISDRKNYNNKKIDQISNAQYFFHFQSTVWNRWDLARYKPPSLLIFWDKNILNCRFDNSIIGSI